jgi:hypothetical protein
MCEGVSVNYMYLFHVGTKTNGSKTEPVFEIESWAATILISVTLRKAFVTYSSCLSAFHTIT